MTLFRVILFIHIAAGTVGLVVLGPVAMGARKAPGLHTPCWRGVPLGGCRGASAAGLAALEWERLWWFLLIAAGSYAFALFGYVTAKRRWRGWLRAHITGQGGSYIAMVTALLVVNWKSIAGRAGISSPWAWALPTMVGSPLIAWVTYQVRLGKRPRP